MINKKNLRYLIRNLQMFGSPDEDNPGGNPPAPGKGENDLTTDEYIKNIRTLKETTVPKSDYEKVLEEKKQLAKALLEGQPGESEHGDDSPSIEDLRKKLFTGDLDSLSNLEYAKAAVELRNKLIEEGKPDPFLPQGMKTTASQSDVEAAQRVADTLQECIDLADGDSGAFTAYLMSRVSDTPFPKRKA